MLLTTFTHNIWKQIVPKGSFAIDATCGNGHDALMLAELALDPSHLVEEKKGHLLAIDLQEKAISSTKKRLENELSAKHLDLITFQCASHEDLKKNIKKAFLTTSIAPSGPFANSTDASITPLQGPSADIITYNLGYLPGGDKNLTTKTPSTLSSLQSALMLLKSGGWLSITCYIGHTEGALEGKAAIDWAKSLSADKASVFHCTPMRTKAPFLILIQKS